MAKPTDIRVRSVKLHLLPVTARIPLKFGTEVLTQVVCARAWLRVEDRRGRSGEGWGETPLSVQWVWPSKLPFGARQEALISFCSELAKTWVGFGEFGHPMELGADFLNGPVKTLLERQNAREGREREAMPWLAGLLCSSPFDQALHDAFGNCHKLPTYSTYGADHMNRQLGDFLEPFVAGGSANPFSGKYPADYLRPKPLKKLMAWHLVGGLDPIEEGDETVSVNDGHPIYLKDWIKRDGLKCLKIKLRGNDAAWDLERLIRVGTVAVQGRVAWLSADFNCTVTEPEYVNRILDALRDSHPRLYGMLLYVEQPFPYDLETNPIDVRSVAARKPLFLDESAHDWRHIRTGRGLGWSGVALKTCKTQTGAILSACWAQQHGMTLMVQDLTNPMLAQIPHLLLAAHTETIMGVETNSMQFYPDASEPEAKVHPGLYQRRRGRVDLRTLKGNGFGYRVIEIARELPGSVVSA